MTLAACKHCLTRIGWVDCPTGSWWSHEVHPVDNHDAEPLEDPRPVFATKLQLQCTIADGWRLSCGCLHLFIKGQPPGEPTIFNIVTDTTKPSKCKEIHQ